MADAERSALAFSGGGAYGAFQVGAVEALARGCSPATGFRPLAADVYTGTSAGAFNATFLAAKWRHSLDQAAAQLRDAWIELISQKENAWGCGVVRYRANPFKFLNPAVFLRNPLQWGANLIEDSVHIASRLTGQIAELMQEKRSDPSNAIMASFDVSTFATTEPFSDTLRRAIDYESLRSCPHHLAVVATEWASGVPRVFGRDEIARQLGPDCLRGSASIPGLFPPIFLDDSVLVDGGVVMNVPMEPAIQAGANVIYVLSVAPRQATNSQRVLRSTVGSMLSAQLAAWRYALKVKLETTESVNYILDRAARTRAHYRRIGGGNEAESRILAELEKIKELYEEHMMTDYPELRPVTVHVVQPEEQLGGGPLGMVDFHQDYLAEHIEEGYRQAVEHDCEANGCVLAGTEDGG